MTTLRVYAPCTLHRDRQIERKRHSVSELKEGHESDAVRRVPESTMILIHRLRKRGAMWVPLLFAIVIGTLAFDRLSLACAASKSKVTWGAELVVDDPPTYNGTSAMAKSALDARKLQPGIYGDDYPRAVKLANGHRLLVFTTFIQGDPGYLTNPRGGTCLVIEQGSRNGRTWKQISTICDPGRDVDNGEFIQLADGDILLGTRSVRWQESYRLPVYRSTDMGQTWEYLSTVDSNEGQPGELGAPDKGVYEPHFFILDNKRLAVMYSTEKHVVDKPSYSQTVAERISDDNGKTWGKEIWVSAGGAEDRPGMPVWTKMKNGRYIVVHENCGSKKCDIFSQTSNDGIHWEIGEGTPVPEQRAAPYLLSLEDGRLILTSNNHNVSMSEDYGKSWSRVASAFEGGQDTAFFSSIYQVNSREIMIITGARRPQGGRRIVIRFGTLESQVSRSDAPR